MCVCVLCRGENLGDLDRNELRKVNGGIKREEEMRLELLTGGERNREEREAEMGSESEGNRGRKKTAEEGNK